MQRPNINYGSSEWREIAKALGQMILQLDVVNRDMGLSDLDTLRNRALQQAYQTIIGWGRDVSPQQTAPVYAVPPGGYDPDQPHPDDEPV